MAKKQITAYVCTECGADSPRWAGQCTSCGEWNVIKEIRLGTDKKSRTDLSGYANERSEVKLLSDELSNTANSAKFDIEIKKRVCNMQLVTILNKFKLDHIYLKDHCFSKVNDYKKFQVSTVDNCNLGDWMKKQELNNACFTKTSNWQQLKKYHKEAHSSIQDYIDKNADKICATDLNKFAIDTERNIEKTLCLIDKIKSDNCNNCGA